MRELKKVILILIAVCLLTSLPVHAARNLSFADVPEDSWYREYVQYVFENGIMTGTGGDSFSPNLTTTRGMIVTILYRISGEPEAEEVSFSDVPSGAWYTDAVSWAGKAGIVLGYGNGKFGPDDPVTREQMVSILFRYTDYCGYETNSTAELSRFSDRESISSYAVDGMTWAVAEGLISGVGNDMLAPGGLATRAEVAAIITRYMGLELKLVDPELGSESLGRG